jgi:hypothetical protein
MFGVEAPHPNGPHPRVERGQHRFDAPEGWN